MLVKSVPASFDDILDYVRTHGEQVEARDYETVEIRNFAIRVSQPDDHFVWDDERLDVLKSEIDTVRRGVEPDVTFPELDDKLDLDDGTFYESIIRERISEDWDEWVSLLTEDPQTRKACSLFGAEPDPPCTSRIQWLIRDGQLDLYTYNRSQDMEFAFPMDIGLFEEYQCQLAEELGVPLGRHHHLMTSAHIYV